MGRYALVDIHWLGLISESLKNIYTEVSFRTFGRHVKNEILQLHNFNREEKFSLYHCHKDQTHSRDPYLLMLLIKKLYDEDGFKIGFESEECKVPFSQKTIKDIHLVGSLMDFSQASEVGILKTNWVETTPGDFYDIYAKWWFKEKP